MERGDVSLDAFERQMEDINQHGFGLDSLFGGCAIQTITDKGTKKPCDQIFREINQVNSANSWDATGDKPAS